MAKLTDTQSILLAHAAQQEGGSIYPLPASLTEDGNSSDRAVQAIGPLLGRGLAVERETNAAASICRAEGDLSYGMFITSIGLTAIGIDDGPGGKPR